jgi:ATP-binding cassette subfamily C protein
MMQRNAELQTVFSAVRGYFITAGVFSLFINLLYLAGPLYMLQVYDRVISSGSATTLVMLTIALLVAFAALASLDVVRGRIMARAGLRLDAMLADRVVASTLATNNLDTSKSQPLRDFDTFRQFVSGQGVHALFDLPWVPVYVAVIFMLHPLLGAFAVGCVIFLIVLALVNEWLVRGVSNDANAVAAKNYHFTETSLRNGEVIRAMGMINGLLERWSLDRNLLLKSQLAASDRAGTMSSVIKFSRLSMQSLVLGLGAYLAIQRFVTVGAMFAASILLGRALQPVEQVVAGWRGLLAAHGAYLRVRKLLEANPLTYEGLVLPRPTGQTTVQSLTYVPPGTQKPILRGISFRIDAGEALGIIGPSGAGKSTLVRLLVGVINPTMGHVRLDGADIATWPRHQLGRYIGYLPQDIELFADTVAANISRFSRNRDESVIEAAKLAGAHEMILQLPKGYDTPVGEGGLALSGGYRQRIALARAVFGYPSLVILDEPSSNLDSEGDDAFAKCIANLKERNTTIVIISHRPPTLAGVDKLMVLKDGVIDMYGEREQIIQKLIRPATKTPATRGQSKSGERAFGIPARGEIV